MTPEQAIRDELMALLRYANKSEVARALKVTPQAVINWSEGRNTSPARLLQVRRLYGLPDTTKEAAPPEWAERLANVVADRVIESLAPGPLSPNVTAALPRLIAVLEASQRLGSEEPPVRNGTEGPVEQSQAGPIAGSSHAPEG